MDSTNLLKLSSTYPPAPIVYINNYTNENVKNGMTPPPPPLIRVSDRAFIRFNSVIHSFTQKRPVLSQQGQLFVFWQIDWSEWRSHTHTGITRHTTRTQHNWSQKRIEKTESFHFDELFGPIGDSRQVAKYIGYVVVWPSSVRSDRQTDRQTEWLKMAEFPNIIREFV